MQIGASPYREKPAVKQEGWRGAMTQPHEFVARATVMNGWGGILERQTLPGLANRQ